MEKQRIGSSMLARCVLLLGFVTFTGLASCNRDTESSLRVAISPYQDIAMLVNLYPLKLQDKYNTRIELVTLNWEDILPAVASVGRTVDVGFGSYIEYLTKYSKINSNSDDPVLFLYPAYVFSGGGFITFKPLPKLDKNAVRSLADVKRFFSHKIGSPQNTIYDMMLYSLAENNHYTVDPNNIFNISLNDGLLATENGSLDIAAAGLTQITEAQKKSGNVILTMEEMGFADITGFICKRSTFEKRQREVRNLIRMWFDSVDYVFQDLDNNSKHSLKYLAEKAATKYSLDQYKTALSQEYFPRSISEAERVIVSESGQFGYMRIKNDVVGYLLNRKLIETTPDPSDFIDMNGTH